MIYRLISIVFTLCLVCRIDAQAYEPAVAYPMENITVDGDLEDWPEDMDVYNITQLAFADTKGPKDLSAHFRIGYNSSFNSIFIGVEVVDDAIVVNNEEQDLELLDYMYLYLDPVHDRNGGGRNLFQAGGELRYYEGPRVAEWDPYTPVIDWGNVDVKVQSQNGKIIYEWRISLIDKLEMNSALGFDIIISDFDSSEEEDTWLTWRQGTGKSRGSQLLGEVIIAKSKGQIGMIEGSVVEINNLIRNTEFIIITSRDNPGLWARIGVDSSGKYKCNLPEGLYGIEPEKLFTSPVFSDGFNQNTKKIYAENIPIVEVISSGASKVEQLRLNIRPLPGGMFDEEGQLFQKEIDEYKIDKFLEAYQNYFEIPAVSLALIKDGEVVYDKSFGVVSKLTNQPIIHGHSLYEGASITKPVFSLMVLKLAEKGMIDLDKPLYEYLSFPNIEHDERYKMITARHVLHHQSGLENWSVGSYSGIINDVKANLMFDPGSDTKYSGEAMNYLGRVVEKITSKPLHQFFKEEIVATFGLENTYFHYREDMKDRIAMGHYQNYIRYKDKYPGVDSPASNIETEASDFSKILVGLLKEEYLSKDSYQLIYEPQQLKIDNESMYDAGMKQGFAHGFHVTETPQGKLVVHGGNNGDYESKFGIMPGRNIGFVVFATSNLGDEFIRLLELFLFRGIDAFETEFGK